MLLEDDGGGGGGNLMTDSAFVTNYITIVLNLIKYIFKISTFMHSCEERSI